MFKTSDKIDKLAQIENKITIISLIYGTRLSLATIRYNEPEKYIEINNRLAAVKISNIFNNANLLNNFCFIELFYIIRYILKIFFNSHFLSITLISAPQSFDKTMFTNYERPRKRIFLIFKNKTPHKKMV